MKDSEAGAKAVKVIRNFNAWLLEKKEQHKVGKGRDYHEYSGLRAGLCMHRRIKIHFKKQFLWGLSTKCVHYG